jgi:predicted transcriptional regulator
MSDDQPTSEDLIQFTTDIVSAYVRKNNVPQGNLAKIISAVHGALAAVVQTEEVAPVFAAVPAVPVKKSVQPHEITCLDCGKAFKSIRRHLNTSHSMTPEAYREKWSLPANYPMTAPNYAEQRSQLARDMGLGQTRTRPKRRKNAA